MPSIDVTKSCLVTETGSLVCHSWTRQASFLFIFHPSQFLSNKIQAGQKKHNLKTI